MEYFRKKNRIVKIIRYVESRCKLNLTVYYYFIYLSYLPIFPMYFPSGRSVFFPHHNLSTNLMNFTEGIRNVGGTQLYHQSVNFGGYKAPSIPSVEILSFLAELCNSYAL